MKNLFKILVGAAPFLADLFRFSKTDEKKAIAEVDERVAKERAEWAKKYGKDK